MHLSLLDGSCKRNLSVTSPLVEAASPQYIALGAGSSVVNGTYDLSGWYNGGPVYVNSVSGVSISVEELGEGRKGWVIGENLPSIIYYGNPGGVNRIRPPDLHWTFVAGGVGEDPPPTVCMCAFLSPFLYYTMFHCHYCCCFLIHHSKITLYNTILFSHRTSFYPNIFTANEQLWSSHLKLTFISCGGVMKNSL